MRLSSLATVATDLGFPPLPGANRFADSSTACSCRGNHQYNAENATPAQSVRLAALCTSVMWRSYYIRYENMMSLISVEIASVNQLEQYFSTSGKFPISSTGPQYAIFVPADLPSSVDGSAQDWADRCQLMVNVHHLTGQHEFNRIGRLHLTAQLHHQLIDLDLPPLWVRSTIAVLDALIQGQNSYADCWGAFPARIREFVLHYLDQPIQACLTDYS